MSTPRDPREPRRQEPDPGADRRAPDGRRPRGSDVPDQPRRDAPAAGRDAAGRRFPPGRNGGSAPDGGSGAGAEPRREGSRGRDQDAGRRPDRPRRPDDTGHEGERRGARPGPRSSAGRDAAPGGERAQPGTAGQRPRPAGRPARGGDPRSGQGGRAGSGPDQAARWDEAPARDGGSPAGGARPGRGPRGAARHGTGPGGDELRHGTERPRDGRPREARPRDERARDERPRDDRPREGRARDERPGDGRPRDGRARAGHPRDQRPRDERTRRSGGSAGPRVPRPQVGGRIGRPRPPYPRGGRPARGAAPTTPLRLADPRRRLRTMVIALGLVLALFVGRLVQLQFLDASALAADAAVNRYVVEVLPATRGSITDASGNVLATTVDTYDITADPYLFSPGQVHIDDAPARAARLLSPLLGVDAATLTRKLTYTGSRYVMLAAQQSPQTWNKIKALRNQAAGNASSGRCLAQQNAAAKAGAAGRVPEDCADLLAGIVPQSDSKRVYPDGALAANILGFVNASGTGAGGLELQYNAELAGKDGKLRYAQSNGREVPTAGQQRQDPVPGTDIRLTLNRDIQWDAQQQISAEVARAHAKKGYVVVQDVHTGRILAMAASPGFDPNDLAAASSGALGNPALSDAYEPGSVAKLITMSAVLEQNAATPETKIVVPGALPRGGRYFHDDVAHGTWHLTLTGVLAVSSNIGTIEAAEHLGPTQQAADRVLYGYLRRFGIGRPTGLGFPGETPGILAPLSQWTDTRQYTIPFGQGFAVNALQIASAYSTIANGGVRVAPTLVAGTTGPDGVYVPAPAPQPTRVVSEHTASEVAQMLEAVTTSPQGTGTAAQIPGYLVAGKTGTANRVGSGGTYNGYTASFAGFAPADKPAVTVYCAIQDPVGAHFGGQLCAPVFKQVMEFALKSLQVPPTGAAPADLPVDW